jgi:hypothetical protein
MGLFVAEDESIAPGSESANFFAGQFASVSVNVTGIEPGLPVRVVWYAPDNRRIGGESRPVVAGRNHIAFGVNTIGWEPGPYRAVITAGKEKAREARFNIATRPANAAPKA